MTLITDSITVVSDPISKVETTVNHLPCYTIWDVHSSYYGGKTEQPESSWLTGEVALVDPITGYEYCPICYGLPPK